jgi:predicted O-linked N-acetylglucosamine transferase (SPINDLY family)
LPEVHNNLGVALLDLKRFDDSISAFEQAIRIKPDLAEAHSNLGNALTVAGRPEEAFAAYRKAIGIHQDYAEGYFNFGNALSAAGRIEEAVESYQQAIRIKPTHAGAHANLGNALLRQQKYVEAMESFHRMLAFDPNDAITRCNLGNVLKDTGRLDEAIAYYREAVWLQPTLSEVHSNLLYALQAHPLYEARAIYEEHRRWNEVHGAPLAIFIQHPSNDRNPDRRLKVGYVSPDFRDHVVGQNLLPLLREHDHKQFEIFCYANMNRGDALTEEMKGYADSWRGIAEMSDATAADLIRRDKIDILVDLSLHTGRNRLLIFARKPAPVQMSYLGYCSTTGLDAMDYRFSDPFMDPAETDLSIYSEKTVRLPETYWCYNPREATPEVAPLPAKAAGYVTFGSLNNFAKSASALGLWAEILNSVPNSRLILHSPEGPHRDDAKKKFEAKGISADRVDFQAHVPWPEYVQTYGRIDIGLDPFPWGGGITTCDTLWMGVPVVSLLGRTAVGRGGASVLGNIGLGKLVGKTPEEYMKIAVELANDLPRLAELRRGLRGRMQSSPLMDAPRFGRNVEAAYRKMWREWCEWQRIPPM